MLTRVEIKNYRSIYDASVPLSPFTLLIGANGTGKSNFLKLMKDVSAHPKQKVSVTQFKRAVPVGHYPKLLAHKHYAHRSEGQRLSFTGERSFAIKEAIASGGKIPELENVKIFSLNPHAAGKSEALMPSPAISEDGEGIVRVLDELKTGDREDLFDKIEATLRQYVPEVEKLSFVPRQAQKSLQVREKSIPQPVLVQDLSEGTQLALLIITLLHQERRPSLICIEDIDRGLHPRLFQQIVQLCFDLSSSEGGVQIIATTHNPYLVDEFKDHEDAVIIVEKENGKTTFTPLAEKLESLEPEEEPLGSLWYSGFVGGVPQGV